MEGMYAGAKSNPSWTRSPVLWLVVGLVLLFAWMGGAEGILFVLYLGGGMLLYFLPTLAAVKNEHPQRNAIALLNFFAGWTFVGWVGALVWAFVKK